MRVTIEAQKVGAMGPCQVSVYRNERVMWRTSEHGEWVGHPAAWELLAELRMTDASEHHAAGGVTRYALLPEFTLEATCRRPRGTENRFDDIPRAVYTAIYEHSAEGDAPEASRAGVLPFFENLTVPESLGPRTTYAAIVRANMKPEPGADRQPAPTGEGGGLRRIG